jgi:hypothetical protein
MKFDLGKIFDGIKDGLKDSLVEELLPLLIEEGLNLAIPKLGDIVAKALENIKQKLPQGTQDILP